MVRDPIRDRAAGVALLVAIGVLAGSLSWPAWVLVVAAAFPAAVVVARLGAERVVTGSMMAAAVAAPLNGVRAGGVAVVDVFLLVALVTVVVARPPRSRGAHRPPTPVTVGLVLIVAGGLLGTAFAADRGASVLNLARFGVAAALPIVVLFSWRPDMRRVRRLVGVWVGAATVSGLVSLLSAGDVSGRVAGLTTHSNHLAIISSLGAGAALAFATAARGWQRGAAGMCYLVLALTVVETGSRAGLLALLVTTGFLAARVATSRMAAVSAGLLLVGAALVATGLVQLGEHNAVRRIQGDATSALSDEERRSLLEANVERVATNPVTGHGFELVLQAHNIYVQVWASAGVLGLLGLVLVARGTVGAGLGGPAPHPGHLLRVAMTAGYVGYLAAGLFQNILWDRYLWLHVAVVLWLGALASSEAEPAPAAGADADTEAADRR